MNFNAFKQAQDDYLKGIFNLGTPVSLFTSDVNPDELYELYLSSFPVGTNEVYRKQREHECSACRQFIKRFGTVIIVVDGKRYTAWDFEFEDATYGPVKKVLAAKVAAAKIAGVFRVGKELSMIGVHKNHETDEGGNVREWRHLAVKVPEEFCLPRNDEVASVCGNIATTHDMFIRACTELTTDAFETVEELIKQNSLYRGDQWKEAIADFLKLKAAYEKAKDKDLYAWLVAEDKRRAGRARIRNTSIGTLLVDISEGQKSLDDAVSAYEKVVAPENYRRTSSLVTPRMREEAKKKIIELGLGSSLARRFAKLSDISVNDILFVDRKVRKNLGDSQLDVFDKIGKRDAVDPKAFDRLTEISLEAFLRDVLPDSWGVELFVENRHMPNLMSLIAPVDADAIPLTQWPNNKSWAYRGNVTDSMKERVKAAGGNVEGYMRASICWNEDHMTNDDLDIHCMTPRWEIYFGNKRCPEGYLDVDIIEPNMDRRTKDGVAVENIAFPNKRDITDGKYRFFVRQYYSRGGKGGFTAEIEIAGEVWQYSYPQPVRGDVPLATVTVKNGEFTIEHALKPTNAGRVAWGMNTMQFHPVTMIMNSPNHWDDVKPPVGTRHVFFMLDGCKSDETPNGFYNEFLPSALVPHRKALELVANELRVEPADEQLSGIGFSVTKSDTFVVRVTGSTTRVLRVKI